MDESLTLPTAAVGSKLADEKSAKDKLLEIQPQRCMFKLFKAWIQMRSPTSM